MFTVDTHDILLRYKCHRNKSDDKVLLRKINDIHPPVGCAVIFENIKLLIFSRMTYEFNTSAKHRL